MHGGDIYTEGILKGKKLIDFSSNINPLGLPDSFKDNLEEALSWVQVYPDIQYRTLKRNLIDYLSFFLDYFYKEKVEKLNIKEENLVLGNGAVEIIDLAISNLKSISILVPSFVEYELCAEKWNVQIDYCNLNEDMTYNYENIKKSLEKTEGIVLGNPNNPNGSVIDKEKFIYILDYCEKNNKIVILDEAFIEFTGKNSFSFLNLCKRYKCIFIIRALTKFFSMPGIRFGYGISFNNEFLNKIREKQNPWNINCFAEIAVKYVLKDEDFIEKSISYIEKEKIFMYENLNKCDLFHSVYSTYSNFILCKLKDITGYELKQRLLEKGFVLRVCKDFKTLNNDYVRFAIKTRELNQALVNILKEIK
ncbi:histidinol-phosphate transaminase [Clostridium sporogenes]|uniref:Aminotransferase class I/II-fold pyridoxal phosphate-dependent enzyme n=2 Tax=Clostridium TaxID=1485 RepID=A0A7U4LM51_CLOSG|nr:MULTISPECIES: histidinol-phosphate transaminase [Clostridium]AJD30565.1 aminotransferase class I and II family protein [Clostridium botulinum Prevot_594]AVP59940.1 aspartate aminotransferase [Clostridium botulinum]AKC61633.1 putative threonine-phosphate decarboxylase CobD [Clostridium sporogenes]AKJ88953.1 aspartate aminotransferase [Clostridium sporogenes]AVP64531.1 aspartate aminotransferase [Clostridium botulinum]